MEDRKPESEKSPAADSGGTEEWSVIEVLRKYLDETWFLVLVFLLLGFVYKFVMAWKWSRL